MKKQGECDQCGMDGELDNEIKSTFHRCFKYRGMLIELRGTFFNPLNRPHTMYLCKKCKLEVVRAMKFGDNWE